MPNTSKKQTGFTLIELLVTISIIAILATIGVVAFSGAQKAARDAKRKADVDDIKKAMYLYRSSSGTFCVTGSGTCSTAFTTLVSATDKGWTGTGGATGSLSAISGYMKATKVCDPLNANCGTLDFANDYYISVTSDEAFTIQAKIEGTAPTSQECTATGVRNYCITQ